MRGAVGVLLGAALVVSATGWATASWTPQPHVVLAKKGIVAPDLARPLESADEPPSVPPWVREREHHDPKARPARQWDYITQATDGGCVERLSATEAAFTALPEQAEPDADGCGIPRGVLLTRGPTGLRYSPPLRIDCSLALRLVEIETFIREESARAFDEAPRTVGTRGSYNCREVVGRLSGWSGGISEHSFGNAVDIAHVDLTSGRRVTVLHHYPLSDHPAGRFWRAVVRRLWKEADMRALGPDFDAAHRDHLHVDGGSRWWRWR